MSVTAHSPLSEAVRACSIALLAGVVLQVLEVSAGHGRVIDWRTVRSGETLQDGADAFDTAYLFVTLVGPEAAVLAATRDRDIEPAPPAVEPEPRIATYMHTQNGRLRSFEVGAFRVSVDPIGDGEATDKAHAAFTAALAKAALALPERHGPTRMDLVRDELDRWVESQGGASS
jgi:hypothetical protein